MIDILLVTLAAVCFTAGWIARGLFPDDDLAGTGWQMKRKMRRNRAAFRKSRSR